MLEFTCAQCRAIETDGVDLVVTAGAGSGKTLVLVERFLRLLSSPDRDLRSLMAAPPEQVLGRPWSWSSASYACCPALIET